MSEVDLAHDPKAYPAEQVTRDGQVQGKEEGCALCAGLHLVAVGGHQYVSVSVTVYVYVYVHVYVYTCRETFLQAAIEALELPISHLSHCLSSFMFNVPLRLRFKCHFPLATSICAIFFLYFRLMKSMCSVKNGLPA